MNNWDLARAKCSVPEEKDDKTKNEGGGSGLFSGIGAYKKIGMHELSYRQLIYTYYKQTTATFRKQLVKRSSNEFKKSFAYIDAGTELAEILRYKGWKETRKKRRLINLRILYHLKCLQSSKSTGV